MNVSIKQLAVRMGSTLVLEHLDLDVVEGEFLVLLGPSGCGKSTLLHAVAGLVDTEAGSVPNSPIAASERISGNSITWYGMNAPVMRTTNSACAPRGRQNDSA